MTDIDEDAASLFLRWTERAQPKRLYPDVTAREGVTDFRITTRDELQSAMEYMNEQLAKCSGWRLRQGYSAFTDGDGQLTCTWRIRFEYE